MSVHYYEPHAFTHQNADGSARRRGCSDASGHAGDHARARSHQERGGLERRHGYAMQLGEFGVAQKSCDGAAGGVTRAMREASEQTHRLVVWDLAGAFAILARTKARSCTPRLALLD